MSFKEPFHYSVYVLDLYVLCGIILLISARTPYFKTMLQIITCIIIAILFFFRKHPKPFDTDINTIVSPCEGTIIYIDEHSEHLHIATFLNIHNIHVQYLPCDGIIVDKQYKTGAFHPAKMFEKSQHNERLITTLQTRIGHVYMIQYAGLIARRIVDFQPLHTPLKKGDPFGLIKFGSRVDIYIPKKYISKLFVHVGDTISIGDTLCSVY